MEKIGKKLKHDHTLTSILKFAIFSMVMLAPIFSVASRCLYVICNKNAKDSYSIKQSSDYTIDSTQQTSLQKNEFYYFITNVDLNYYNQQIIRVKNFNFLSNGYVSGHGEVKSFTNYLNQNNHWIQVTYDDNYVSYLAYANTSNVIIATFSFTFEPIEDYETNPYLTNISKIVFGAKNQLDNAFEYSLSQIEESEYYNWATNLGIYTPINNMVSGLGGHSVISLLLAYWSIYTAIYIVFDIIITCFVKITHLIQGE